MPNSLLYAASKRGIRGMTKAIALDYAQHDTRIDAVVPDTIAHQKQQR